MKHKLKQSFWAPLHRPFRRSTTKHHARGARVALVTMLFAMTTSFVLPLLSPATASANADTMKNSVIVKKLAAYNTLLYCSTGFDKDIEGNSVGGFEWANNNGPMTSGYQSIDKGYREGSNDGSEDRDFIAIIKGNVDVTNFASFSGSYATNGADIGLCGSGNLQSVFKILSDGTSAQDLLCKLGYTQVGIKSLPRSSCALAVGKYDPSKDSFTISGSINTNAFKPSPLLTAAASHYVRQIVYFTGRDKGGCDASDASDGQYGAGYELQVIYDYNGTNVGPYTWKKTTGCGVDDVIKNRNSQGIKDFLKAFDVELVSAAQTQCEALFPPSTAGGTVGEYENQVRNRKIAACVDGTKNKSAGYCELTYLGVSATADHEIQTEYEKKYGEEAAKELQNACLQGQGVDVSIDSTTPPSSDPCSIIPPDTPMSWLACSVFTAVSNITKGMEAQMTDILYSDADSMFKDNTTFKHASDIFRNISMALIVITGLVMIIAEASSLELFDAYTIKKVLPRLGIALVGMALSWPLLKLSVTLSNDVGFAVRDLFDKFAQTTAGGGSVSDAASGIGSVITTFLGGGLVVGALGIWGAILLGVSLLISYVTGIIVLFMQKLLLILIVLVAPIAIASSVLPGTEKLWKLWRSNLFKVLAMFTVIIAIIKVGDVAASVAFAANQPLMAFGAKIASLVLTFKAPQFTGQMLGGIMGMMSGAAYKMAGAAKAPIDKARQQEGAMHRERTYGRRLLSAQAQAQRGLKSMSTQVGSNTMLGRALRGAGRAVGGYNLEARMSQRQAAVAKELNDQIATGMDDEIRGLSVDKASALRGQEGVDWQRTANGGRQFKTLGGYWVDEAAVDEGHRRWGHDHYAQQAALSYEMRKANSEDDVNRISSRYQSLAKGAWHMTDTEAKGAWIGAAFENQQQHIEFKKTNWENGDVNYDSLADEIYEKKGSYPLAQMHSRTIERLKQGYKNAQDIVAGVVPGDVNQARERMMKIEAITETFMNEYGGGGGAGGYQIDPATGQPIAFTPQRGAQQQAAPQPGGASGANQPSQPAYRVANTPGAAHTAERVQELAVMTGAFAAAPTGTYNPATHQAANPTTVRNDGTTINVGGNTQNQNRP